MLLVVLLNGTIKISVEGKMQCHCSRDTVREVNVPRICSHIVFVHENGDSLPLSNPTKNSLQSRDRGKTDGGTQSPGWTYDH